MFLICFNIKLTLYNFDLFINLDFLNIHLKYLKNNLFKIDLLIENLIKFKLKTRDFDFFVNHNFLNICLKYLKNNIFIIYSIKQAVVSKKLFIF